MKYSIFFFELSAVLTLLLEIPEIFISKLSFSFQTPSRLKWNHSSVAFLVNSHKETLLSCQQWNLWWVLLESSDKTWSTGEGNGKTLQHSCLENPMNSMKRQKDMTLKDELFWLAYWCQYSTGEEWRNSSRKNEEAEPNVNVSGDKSSLML